MRLISFKVANNRESGRTGCYETNPGGRYLNDTLSTLESKAGLGLAQPNSTDSIAMAALKLSSRALQSL